MIRDKLLLMINSGVEINKLLLMINSGVEINKLYLEVLWMIQK